jgi:hypothetical protein
MTSLFSGGPSGPSKADKQAQAAQQKAQRRQDQAIQKQTADEAIELGTRRRLAAARSSGRNSLFSTSGAAGVQDTLG